MCKYGDFTPISDIKDKYGVTNVVPFQRVTRIEGRPNLTCHIMSKIDNRHSNQRTEKEFQNYESTFPITK